MPSQSRVCSVARPSFRAAAADDVYPGTKHNGASVCSLYLLEKLASKIDRSNMFRTKTFKFCLRIISFSSLESELSFDLKDSKINLDRARSATQREITAWSLGAICNILSDDGEDLFADELFVYKEWRARYEVEEQENEK